MFPESFSPLMDSEVSALHAPKSIDRVVTTRIRDQSKENRLLRIRISQTITELGGEGYELCRIMMLCIEKVESFHSRGLLSSPI